MKRRTLVALTLAIVLVPAAAISLGALVLRDGNESESSSGGAVPDPGECRDLASDEARACYTRDFTQLVVGEEDPRKRVRAIADSAWGEGGFLLANCHGIMHTVARRYVEAQDVSLATLMDYLPQGNDPGCTAGFAHGLVTGVAPDIDPSQPRQAANVCGNSATRYQRYSCTHGFGHAFMRLHSGDLRAALGLCTALGPGAAADCAQGAFHDYWFAVVGADDAKLAGEPVTDPRSLCATQARRFVRPCWYRAFVDNRPEGFRIEQPVDFDRVCAGLRGLQREGCVTAASVIGPPDPALQLQLCAALEPADAASCIRGTKVQNLLEYPRSSYVELAKRCELFRLPTRTACYRWLGKTISVVTDGEFGRTGCPRLPVHGRKPCAAGAATMEGPLETFS